MLLNVINNKSPQKYVSAVGIDLGTTNSLISVLQKGVPIIITNSNGLKKLPSIVAFNSKKELLIGNLAKHQLVVNTENTFYSFKRFIGNQFKEIELESINVLYKIEEDEKGNIKLYCPILKKYFYAEEVSAIILKSLINNANKFLKQKIKNVVITVPAYFNDSQRLATKDAGIIAGLNVLRILNEPTAAALAYGLKKNVNQIILVFDLGGGTFDVSILEIGNEIFEVISTSGNSQLGGNDFDSIIANYIIKDFFQKENIDLSKETQSLQKILEASEKAKIELSFMQFTNINIPFVFLDKKNKISKSINIKLTRAKFEELSSSLLEKCKHPILNALKDANLSKEEINKIILVGGSTRIPAVKNLLKNLLNKDLTESVNPDEVVAMGAAIQAAIIVGEITNFILLDVTPLSLGIETICGVLTVVIPRNTSIPIKKTELFSTSFDNQKKVEIHILQGEKFFVKNNKSLGLFILENLPLALKGSLSIAVTFDLTLNGILFITAKEKNLGIVQSIQITKKTI